MKVADSYASLLRGVSQQVPHERGEGQHTEQVNMLSDPVNGLTRRHGSQWQAEVAPAGLTVANLSAYIADTASYRSVEWDTGGKEYVVVYRTAARPAGSNLPTFIVYNKTDKVFLSVVRSGGDSGANSLDSGGVSALTAVGRYLFMGGNTITVTGSSINRLSTSAAVAWVRGGAYGRTYTIVVNIGGGTLRTATYKTPVSSYQGTLSTSDIPADADDYTKQVNDRVNAYNTEVTKWVGTAAAAIQPEAIAQSLLGQLALVGVTAYRNGSHLFIVGVEAIQVDDGGDGSLLYGVASEVSDVSKLTDRHVPNWVVRVRTGNSSDSYYMKATQKDPNATGSFTQEVTWVETAGVEHSITGGLFYGYIAGSTFYYSSSASILASIAGGSHPTFSVSTAGDSDSNPQPSFVGSKITYLGTFQNRLLVGSGGVLSVSKVDDYLNFYRSTVLTVPADDPFEMLPQGSEDDVLRHGTFYDQDLVLFGKKRQYRLSGSTALTPTGANMPVLANYEGVADVPPIAAGGFIFYAKLGTKSSSLNQIQPGQTENSPESFPASSQINSYIKGNAIEMAVATGTPNILFMRAAGARQSVYTFAYLDKQDGRKMDAWSRWDFNAALGSVIGINPVQDGLLTFSLRVSGTTVYFVADLCPTLTDTSDYPYLDSQRSWSVVEADTTSLKTTSGAQFAAAFDFSSGRKYTGTLLPNVQELLTNYPGEPGLRVGAVNEAYVTPTNPYMRDSKGKAILSGRLTITKFIVAYKNSTGFSWRTAHRGFLASERTFNGRILGDPNNIIGVEPTSTGQYSIPIGYETRNYSLDIMARRWYPFTLTALEWTGQFFNRVQRF